MKRLIILLLIGLCSACQTTKSWYEITTNKTALQASELDNVPDSSQIIIAYSFLPASQLMNRMLEHLKDQNIDLQSSDRDKLTFSTSPTFIGQNTQYKMEVRLEPSEVELFKGKATIRTFYKEGGEVKGQAYAEDSRGTTFAANSQWQLAEKSDSRSGYAFFHAYQLAKSSANLMKFE